MTVIKNTFKTVSGISGLFVFLFFVFYDCSISFGMCLVCTVWCNFTFMCFGVRLIVYNLIDVLWCIE